MTATQQPLAPPRLSATWPAFTCRVISVMCLLAGTYVLPSGNRLWLGALVVPLLPALVAGAMRRDTGLRLPELMAPGGVWLGLGVFLGVVSNLDKAAEKIRNFPTVDVPYRPDLLALVTGAAVLLAYALIACRMIRAGWPVPRTCAVVLISLALASASVAATVMI